jgi:hypothetical protein
VLESEFLPASKRGPFLCTWQTFTGMSNLEFSQVDDIEWTWNWRTMDSTESCRRSSFRKTDSNYSYWHLRRFSIHLHPPSRLASANIKVLTPNGDILIAQLQNLLQWRYSGSFTASFYNFDVRVGAPMTNNR